MVNPAEAGTPARVLKTLSELLSLRSGGLGLSTEYNHYRNRDWSNIPWENSRATSDAPAEDASNGCDFSSFPSLSLHKEVETEDHCSVVVGESASHFHHKGQVEAHVASLLSRPLLVSNDPQKVNEEPDEDDESFAFMLEGIEKVPLMMQQNLVASFLKLVQSRLRAYATFLANHGLTVAACADTDNELDDGVSGVNQKLETLLVLGQHVSLGEVKTSFAADADQGSIGSDGDDQKAYLPLTMQASITILIPTVRGEPTVITETIQAPGSITGIFTKASLLRVVQLDLHMMDLLGSMKEAAASVVSQIVNETNAVFALPLSGMGPVNRAHKQHDDGKHHLFPLQAQKKKRPHIVEDDCPCPVITPDTSATITPDVSAVPASSHPSDLDLTDQDDDVSSLSPDKCGKIVDCLFDTIDIRVLSPPGKRARFSPTDDSMGTFLTPPLA